jgi:phosphoenolpyruvate synthase/pyruvate phosphate dikinase
MIRYKNTNWQLFVTRNMSFFHECSEIPGVIRYGKLFGVPPRYQISIITENGTRTSIFQNEKRIKIYNRGIVQLCLSSKIKNLEKIYKKYGNNLLKISKKIEKDFSLKTFREFIEAYEKFEPSLPLTATLGRVIHQLLIEELKKLYSLKNKQEIEFIASEITYPEEHTPLFNSQLSLLKIGSYIQKNKVKNFENDSKIKRMLQIHRKNYGHIPVNFNEEPWSTDDIFSQLKDLLKIECQKEINSLLKSHRVRIKKAKNILKQINNKKIFQIATSLQIGTFLNEYRKNVFSRASLAYRFLFQNIAQKFNLFSWKEIWKLTPQEIERLYYQNDKSVLRVLPQRKVSGIEYVDNKQGFRILPPKIVKLFFRETVLSKEKNVIKEKELKGTIANQGIARGIAKVILGKSDFHKFKDNDVIVTTMTSVDFVPIMKRASAFVTNEGGITSHASIVSRELGKPCIIGAKIATKVLKDGDLVEVDAEKGVVKLFKAK